MKNEMLDTSFVLERGVDGVAKETKNNDVFITDIVLQELDGKKGAEGSVGYNARSFFRTVGKSSAEKLDAVPNTDQELIGGDTLLKMKIGETDQSIHVLNRKHYKTRDINDSKIIEVAKDYDMTLVTFDMAQKVRAISEGVEVMIAEDIKDAEKIILPKKSTNLADSLLLLVFFGVVLFMLVSPEFKLDHIFTMAFYGLSFVLFITAMALKVTSNGNDPIRQRKTQALKVSNNNDNPNRQRKTQETSIGNNKECDWMTDPSYSSMGGNIFH